WSFIKAMSTDSHKLPNWLLVFAVIGIVTVFPNTTLAADSQDDPFEVVNRPVYQANDLLDQYVAGPVSQVYIDFTPEPLRSTVSNFFDNLLYLNVVLNDFLQGKGEQGLADSGRFLINTTFGAFGLFDVATPLGLKRHDEDFGQTLAVWGMGKGSYLVLPFLGPKTARDVPDIGVSAVTNILFYVSNPVIAPVAILGFIDQRSRFDQAIQIRNELAVEPYLFTREAYIQHRNFLIYDGDPPIDDDDLFLDESFAELEDEAPFEAEDDPDLPKQKVDPQANSTDPSDTASISVSIR
ncbi:MAG: VacJ family lipoprotein, partial [Nitrospirales bacterium]